jgi:hypothetical protein
MNRFQFINLVFVLGLLSCKTVNCGSGTVEVDGKCVVSNKKSDDGDENQQLKDSIQSAVDKKIESWQTSWTRANGTFGVRSAKGTVINFEIRNGQYFVLVDVDFQFTYGKKILIRPCLSSDFCTGSFKEGQNNYKAVIKLNKSGSGFIYVSHYFQ